MELKNYPNLANSSSFGNLNDFEKRIHNSLVHNSILFLRDGIGKIIIRDKSNPVEDHDIVLLAITMLQTSLELSIKALAIEHFGIQAIVERKFKQEDLESLESLYDSGKLRIQEFDTVKNLVKSRNVAELKREHFDIINDFQKYRNDAVHFVFDLSNANIGNSYDDLIYYIVHIISRILLSKFVDDIAPSELFRDILGWDLYTNLMQHQSYKDAMIRFLKDKGCENYLCIICSSYTYEKSMQLCYCCNNDGSQYAYVDCGFCGDKQTMIYDHLNISLNNNEANSLCINCEEKGTVFRCPDCEKAYLKETESSNKKCSNVNGCRKK